MRTTLTLLFIVFFSLFSEKMYAFDTNENLALGKPAVARDSRDFDGSGINPAFATDGNMSTHWCALWDGAGMGSWIYVDLQNYYMIDRVQIAWRGGRWPNGEWYLQVATDLPDASGNSNWVNVYTGNAGSNTVDGTGTYEFTSTAGRYVRMLGVAQATGYGYNIFEMRVYANAVAEPAGDASGLIVSPSSKTLIVNQPFQFESKIVAENGIPMDVVFTSSWSIEEPSAGATINETSGLFRATQTGTYTITCSTIYESEPFSGLATVTVNPFNTNTNLALNKTATASNGTASNGNDGSLSSRWRSNPANQQEWWQVDLGVEYVINNVTIKMNGDGGARGATYNILVSLTGLPDSWETVVTSAQIPAGSGQEYNSHTFAGVPARYVRYSGLTRGGWDHNFAEFEVKGTGFYIADASSEFTSILFNDASVIENEEVALTISTLDENNSPYLNATITGIEVTEGSPTGVTFEQRSNVWYATGVAEGVYTLTATGVDNDDSEIIITGTATLTVNEARRVQTINLGTVLPIGVYPTNRPIELTLSAVDQYGAAIVPSYIWDIQGAAGGSVTGTNYTPDAKGTASVKATSMTSAGLVQSQTIEFNVITDAPNIALNKPTTSISTATTPGANAVDGSLASQWIVPHIADVDNTYDAWIIINLEEKQNIELVEIIWEGAYSKTFTVDYSNDGIDFTTKYSGSNSGAPTTKVNKFYDNPSQAQYVRIFSTEAGTIYGVKILNVYIHGKGMSTSSTQKIENETIFYPNPATDKLNFSAEVSEAAIFALNGQRVSVVHNTRTMDVSGIARGLYILRTTDALGNQKSTKVEFR